MTTSILNCLQSQVDGLLLRGGTDNSTDLWSSRAEAAIRKFIEPDGRLKTQAVNNFRRNQLFINEEPAYGRSPRDLIAGSRRAGWEILKDRYRIMEQSGDLPWLAKYPIETPGNPYFIDVNGYRFNKRWSNNIRYLSLAARYLAKPLTEAYTSMIDIGGGYGIFTMLIKREFPRSRPILLEFPEQLLLAYFFLKSCHPDWRINTIDAAYAAEFIDKRFINRYDLCLIPIDCFPKIVPGTVEIISHFFSLGEMSKNWFATYINSEVIKRAPYLMTINRFFSMPTYGTDIDVLDYKLHEYNDLHFGGSEYEKDYRRGKWKFFTERVLYTSAFFEFIGERRQSSGSTQSAISEIS